jgi:hypothetical protein
MVKMHYVLLIEFKSLKFRFLLFSKLKTTLLDVVLTPANIYAAHFKHVRIGRTN